MLRLFLVGLIVFNLQPLTAAHAEGKRYAVLVGINKYDHAKLPALDWAVNDAFELAEVLKKPGNDYEVVLLTDEAGRADSSRIPTRANIEKALADVLRKFKKGDTIMVGWAGHGLQFGKECYFCVKDTKPFPTQTETMLALSKVYAQLDEAYDGVKLMLIDACRDDGERGIRAGSQNAPQPPSGVGVLMSCSDGEKASESDTLKHGVFFYHVIEGLKGHAPNTRKTAVTWDSLRAYVKEEVPPQADKLFSRKQRPNELGNLSGVPPVLVALSVNARPDAKTEIVEGPKPNIKVDGNEPKPGEERDLDVGHGVKMRFCWIPGSNGKFKIGSPANEEGRDKDENEHEVAGVDGFWMGKFTVTQSQYCALTGKKNPSGFSAEGIRKDRVNGLNTNDFPVEMVSWDDSQACIEAMRIPTGMRKLGLPSEVQWEWAARGGLANGRPFYWGGQLYGDKANCNGNFPYGTTTKGDYLERTTKVGSFESAARHPWGLCDMAGNVWQWCQDYYGDYEQLPTGKNPVQTVKQSNDRRVLRGGSWGNEPRYCRCASRIFVAPNFRSISNGFRVVCSP